MSRKVIQFCTISLLMLASLVFANVSFAGRILIVCNNQLYDEADLQQDLQIYINDLESEGYVFQSDTDSEVVAHLIADCLSRQPEVPDMAEAEYAPLIQAVQAAAASCRATVPPNS